MAQVINYCKERQLVLILGCHAKSQHVAWRSLDINPRAWLEYLKSINFETANKLKESDLPHQQKAGKRDP
jgi:hypothetical protein